jgi:hypothetical protein
MVEASTHTLLRREKCKHAMDLTAEALGFEVWSCPNCERRVGIDTELVEEFELWRGKPWLYQRTLSATRGTTGGTDQARGSQGWREGSGP